MLLNFFLKKRSMFYKLSAKYFAFLIFIPFYLFINIENKVEAFENYNNIYLAYIKTKDDNLNKLAFKGLTDLSYYLIERTSINPKGVKEIDLKKDNIFFYPIIYWQITKEFIKLDNKSLKKLKSYFDSGGIILFDLVEFSKSYSSLSNNSLYEIKNLFANIGIVNLDLVPKDHTLTKSFYLLSNFPGRWDNRFVLVDLNNLKTKDGVSSVIIGLNDWAGAWAKDENSFPIYQAIPGGERQRELAYRFGINVIMYALTGNYKSDQVHSRSILDRLRKK